MQTSSRLGTPALGALLFLRLALLLIGALAAQGVIAALALPFAREWGAWSGNLYVVAVDIVTIVVVASLVRREGGSLGSLVGRVKASDAGWGLLFALALLATLLAGQFVGNLAVYGGPPPLGSYDPAFRMPMWFGLWCLVVAPVTIALAEELFYRGYLQPRWIARLGTWPGLLLVALFFGLQHIPFAMSSPQAAFVKVLSTFLGGVVLALLYRRFGRLWPFVIGHWLADLVGLGLPPFLLALAH